MSHLDDEPDADDSEPANRLHWERDNEVAHEQALAALWDAGAALTRLLIEHGDDCPCDACEAAEGMLWTVSTCAVALESCLVNIGGFGARYRAARGGWSDNPNPSLN